MFALALIAAGGVMIGLGELITHAWVHVWPFTAEDGVNRTLAAHRTPLLNDVTGVFSTGASTVYAIGATAVAMLVAWFVFRGWREPLFLGGTIAVEASVFLATTLVVNRSRPLVAHLDAAPPTSSFPSGHTAAAVALYGGIALLASRAGGKWPVWLLILIPLAVGGSRLYRGMHHPTDVLAALILGTVALLIMRRAVLTAPSTARTRSMVPAVSRSESAS